MATNRVWYPHFLDFPTGGVAQLTEATPAYNYQEVDEFAASQPYPGYVGAGQAMPGITFRSRAIKNILDEMTRDGIAVCFSGGDVNMWLRSGEPCGIREANDSVEHRLMVLQSSAFMCWESINADQGQPAEINARLDTKWNQSQEPFLWVGTNDFAATPLPGASFQELFTLGPIKLEGVDVGGVTSMRWENTIVREEQASDGEPFPTLQGIRTCSPVINFTTTNLKFLDVIAGAGNERGYKLESAGQGLQVYLRKMDSDTIVEPDNSGVHLLMQGNYGLITARQSSRNPKELEVNARLIESGSGQPPFIVDTATTIS